MKSQQLLLFHWKILPIRAAGIALAAASHAT
jgi:hypothetical protein